MNRDADTEARVYTVAAIIGVSPLISLIDGVVWDGLMGFSFWKFSFIIPPLLILVPHVCGVVIIPLLLFVALLFFWWKRPSRVSFWSFAAGSIAWCIWAYMLSKGALLHT